MQMEVRKGRDDQAVPKIFQGGILIFPGQFFENSRDPASFRNKVGVLGTFERAEVRRMDDGSPINVSCSVCHS